MNLLFKISLYLLFSIDRVVFRSWQPRICTTNHLSCGIFLGDSHSNPRLSVLHENNASLYAAISHWRTLSKELSFFPAGEERKDNSILLYYIRRESFGVPLCAKIASSADYRIIPHAIADKTLFSLRGATEKNIASMYLIRRKIF